MAAVIQLFKKQHVVTEGEVVGQGFETTAGGAGIGTQAIDLRNHNYVHCLWLPRPLAVSVPSAEGQ